MKIYISTVKNTHPIFPFWIFRFCSKLSASWTSKSRNWTIWCTWRRTSKRKPATSSYKTKVKIPNCFARHTQTKFYAERIELRLNRFFNYSPINVELVECRIEISCAIKLGETENMQRRLVYICCHTVGTANGSINKTGCDLMYSAPHDTF